LKMMFDTITEVADRLIDTVGRETKFSGQLEVKGVLSRFTTDVIGSTAFGIECNSLQDETNKFYEMGLKAFSNLNFVKRSIQSSFKNLAKRLHMIVTDPEVAAFYYDVVSKTVEFRENNPHVQRNDFMNLLIKLKNSTGPDSLTFNQIAAQSVIFFLAGYETTSTTLTYCMYELSINQEIQKKARESVEKAIEAHGNKLTYESVNSDMHYLEQCVKGKTLNFK